MSDTDLSRKATDLAVRLVVLALLGYWCFAILRPFLMPIVLGIVIAVALNPIYVRIERLLRGRKKAAAVLLVLLCLAVLLVPTLLLSESLVEGVRMVTARMHEGSIAIPPAPDKVAEWPVVGKPLYETWKLASTNLEVLVERMQPQLKVVGLWLVSIAKQGVVAALLAAIGLLIAGVFWVQGESAVGFAVSVGRRIGGDRGASLVPLAGRAIATVAKGVVGVAAIQAVLAGGGMIAAGVPGAGLWSLLVLIVAVAQLPTIIILGPAVLYLVATSDSQLTVILFAAWSLLVSFSDTLLKPILMGRGSDIPVAVILIGAIGGLILHGLIGLFVGAVVFSIGYTLMSGWIRAENAAEAVGT
jgi:predicted PurR-regulated permease PerM